LPGLESADVRLCCYRLLLPVDGSRTGRHSGLRIHELRAARRAFRNQVGKTTGGWAIEGGDLRRSNGLLERDRRTRA
jgi:hypothetical protein